VPDEPLAAPSPDDPDDPHEGSDAGLDAADDPGTAVPLSFSGGDHTTVRRTRARYGVLGAPMAGAMLALRDILEKPKDDAAVVVEASSDPVDLDEHGITVPLDQGLAAKAPPQLRPPADPAAARAWTQRMLDRNRRRR